MNKAQNILLAGGLAISSIFTLNAQSNDNGSDAKLLADASLTNTEASAKNDALTPAVREGKFSEAMNHSYDNKLLVVYISGAKGTAEKPEVYTAKQYAEILQKAFANSKYTNNPTDIVVFYNETGEDRASSASVLINGQKFETKSGRTVFTPKLVGKHIDTFADAYAKANGIATLTQPSSTDGLALNRN